MLSVVRLQNQIPLTELLRHSYAVLVHLGGAGLFIVGALDSSFLVLPFGNDLLMVAMSARKHALIPYYAFMAAAGSVLGCAVVDILSREGVDKALVGRVSMRRLDYVRRRIQKRAAWALVLVSLMPPPFPFTPFIAFAAAAKYPRPKLLGIVGAARCVRFCAEGLLAIEVGNQLLSVARSRGFEYAMIGLSVISVLASAGSVTHWTLQVKARRVPQRTRTSKT